MTKDTLFMSGTYQFLWLSSLCFISHFIAIIYTYDPESDPDMQVIINREKRIEEKRKKEEEEARAEAWAKEWEKKGDPRAVALEEAKQLLEELKKRHNRK